ncbi:MAG: ATP-binding protein [Inquilinus limosus]|uniref:ATP-binding protein n=1 Tax=Inquilinus limosus TaxID=171674 RepID=A0A952FU46_9PROT|nr:ATP-binding protein [Inquilinus limosus]
MRPNSLPLLPAQAGPAPQDLLLDLVLPSRLEALEDVRSRLDAVLGPLGLDEAVRDRIGLATHEAVANAMIHGNRRDPGRPVELRVLRDGDGLVIRVADHGAGFDPAAVANPLRPENRLRPGGRGLLLMRAMADDAGHAPGANGGTVVILRWRSGGDAPRPELEP